MLKFLPKYIIPKKLKKNFLMKKIIKILLSIIFLCLIFSYLIKIENLNNILKNTNIYYLLLALLFQILSTSLAAYRWSLIINTKKFTRKISFFIKSYFKASFFNQVLPSSIGGDAVRILDLISSNYGKENSIYGVLIDRIVGLIGLLCLNLLTIIFIVNILPLWLIKIIIFMSILGIISFFILFKIKDIKSIKNIIILKNIYEFCIKLNEIYAKKFTLLKHISISIIVHILSVISIYYISIAINLDIKLTILLSTIPSVLLLTVIPISFAGWGVREGTMIFILSFVESSKEKIFSLSVIYGLILIISSVFGIYVWLNQKKFFGA